MTADSFASATLAPRVRISNLCKKFGVTQALKNVSMEVRAGEVHALIGENGAGKSSLLKILSGATRPDAGLIELDGVAFAPQNPWHARHHGIATIYQELNLAPHLTVAENICLGEEPNWCGWMNRRRRDQVAQQALLDLDHLDIPLDAPVRALSLAQQQIVEIARALSTRSSVLLMDEPTSSLTGSDAERLFGIIRRLRDRGVSVVYISHFLEDCQHLCDAYTVLRDGETVAQGRMAQTDLPSILRAMVGRAVDEIYPRTPHTLGRPVLQVLNLAGEKKPQRVSFELRAGEILGIAGLIGAGRTETVRVCFGLDKLAAGKVMVREVDVGAPEPRRSLDSGMALLSENRKEEGLMLLRPVADNLTLTSLQSRRPVGGGRPGLQRFSRGGVISRRGQERITRTWMERLNIRARGPWQPVGELSGGNQQKVALGRLLQHDATILLLDEPTRGVDVGSKTEIYRLIGLCAAQGKAVLFISSYMPELLGICDTIAVMSRGVLSEAKPASHWTEHSIIAAAVGQPATLDP